MKSNWLFLYMVGAAAFLSSPAQAQFTGNNQTNIISGVTSNWTGFYYVGSNYVFDALLIQSSGKLSNGTCFIGYAAGADNNTAIVSGSSTWSNTVTPVIGPETSLCVGYSGSGNSLVISNGGIVSSGVSGSANSYVGYNASASNNSALVTGSGSFWKNGADLYIGNSSSGNSLVISNGGRVIDGYGWLKWYTNLVVVTGSGSVWSNGADLVNEGVDNRVEVRNGALVVDGIGSMSGLRNNVLVTGNGSVWRNSSWLQMSGLQSSVVISNGGALYTAGTLTSYVGYNGDGSNRLVVTGSGSVWTNSGGVVIGYAGAIPAHGTRMLISDGGMVHNGGAAIGSSSNSMDNCVVVSGLGSLWRNTDDLTVGDISSGNSLIISNGGHVKNVDASIGVFARASSNSVIVTGSGSVWSNSNLTLGWFAGTSGNTLTISNGGAVVAGNVVIVPLSGASATLTINGGILTANALKLTNSTSRLFLNVGTLNSSGTSVTNAQQFVVGDGAASANFHLLGGTHSFNNGLRIRTNSFLTGCGTVTGAVVIDPGGSVVADCGGNLTFTGSVTNNGIIHVQNGSVLETYSAFINNGILDIMTGTTNFHSTFINNGTIVNASYFRVTSLTQEGDNMRISWPAVGGRSYVVQVADDLGAGFTDLSPAIVIPGTSLSTANYLDLGGATNTPSRFYRVKLVQ